MLDFDIISVHISMSTTTGAIDLILCTVIIDQSLSSAAV